MTSDLDIYRAAELLLIDQPGDEAALYSAGRADLLLEEGDIEGATIWRRNHRSSRGTTTAETAGRGGH
jgi:hypothetical protein